MSCPDREERRQTARFALPAVVNVATRSEQPLFGGQVVNGSATGLLVSFPGPALPFHEGDRCLASVHLHDGELHVIGTVRRKAPGDDGRHYLGIQYDLLADSDVERLLAHVRHLTD